MQSLHKGTPVRVFLSSNAQDFIEDCKADGCHAGTGLFLSSNAQDFIEEGKRHATTTCTPYS